MTTELTRHLAAPRSRVYTALTTADEVARWRFPGGMTCRIHEFDAVEGGRVRVSLTYESADGVGKTDGGTDTYSGHFVRLVPDELVVEVDAFESPNPELAGDMTMTVRLTDADDGGTLLTAQHEGLPAGLSETQNEIGWREALDRLAQLVEP